eukprot:gene389-563_t
MESPCRGVVQDFNANDDPEFEEEQFHRWLDAIAATAQKCCQLEQTLFDGGKNVPKLRDNNYGNNIIQRMQLDDGTQKGIRTILMERGLWVNGLLKLVDCKDNCPKNNCCARVILAAQPDFASEKNWLQTEPLSGEQQGIVLGFYQDIEEAFT